MKTYISTVWDRVWHIRHVKYQISNLAVEVVGVYPPAPLVNKTADHVISTISLPRRASRIINICINQGHAFKVLAPYDYWPSDWIPNDNSKVVLYDWPANLIFAWWEIDYCPFGGTSTAMFTTSIRLGHCKHDIRPVIIDPVAFSAIIFHISDDWIVKGTREWLLEKWTCQMIEPDTTERRKLALFLNFLSTRNQYGAV